MRDVESFLAAPLLDDDAAGEFGRDRIRVAARHLGWRQNFPAIGLLLDTDDERARALAGNYATEARETIGVWLRAVESHAADADGMLDDRTAWVEGFWASWRAQVLEAEDVERLADGPRDRFMAVFDERMSRFSAEAVGHLRDAANQSIERESMFGGCMTFVGRLTRGIGAFFFPRLGGGSDNASPRR